jgi:hypothetical protein
MTISSQHHYWSHSADAWMFMCLPELWIYGGTVNEACLISSAFFIPGLIDLPLCLTADTLLLPLTVYQQVTYTAPGKPSDEGDVDLGSTDAAGQANDP